MHFPIFNHKCVAILKKKTYLIQQNILLNKQEKSNIMSSSKSKLEYITKVLNLFQNSKIIH